LDLSINYISAGKIGDDYETLSLQTWQDTLKKAVKNNNFNTLMIGAVSRNYKETVTENILIGFYSKTNVLTIQLVDVIDDRTDAVKDYTENIISKAFAIH
ncbi:MAG: hypothetical protein LIO62_03550, partial [Clostridiales bacterium]|nr:hypothetical protein [Clostridiales bacterium]